MNYSSGFCYTKRQELDKVFNETNSSMYNIYAKCYASGNTTLSIVGGANEKCEDTAGIIEFLNDPAIKKQLHVNDVKFSVCNEEVYDHYLGNSSGSIWIYPMLLQKRSKIVSFCLLSSFIREILTRLCPSQGLKSGWLG